MAKPMTRHAIPFLFGLVILAQTATAGDLDDRHLSVVSRTAAEAARIADAVRPTTDFTKAEPHEALPGGATTVPARTTSNAFSQPSDNMTFEAELDFKIGNGLFRKNWVAAPSSTLASDGLGPLYNARACQDCHLKDGRGHPPEAGEKALSMLLRLSIPGGTEPKGIADYLATLPDPTYGNQLQERATPGQLAEGKMTINYTALPVTFADGKVVVLQSPSYSITDPTYGAFDAGLMMSPRIAPQMIGMGLLEATPAADILAHADENDADGNGISGRANIVWSPETNAPMLGRFGLKAAVPTVRQQTASAFSIDMGLSSPLFTDPAGDCTTAQPDCLNAPTGQEPGLRDGLEVDGQSLDLVTYYSRNLGVPSRRNENDPQVLAGKKVFYALGCPACHTPKFVTNRLVGQPEQSFQLIWPYSDLLLHDMGDGLADNRPEGRATGHEWRTAPLWGIGLTQTVSGQTHFLHDGRARTLMEAILWHGGEGVASRDAMLALPKPDRDTLIAFLESL
jgi:CxxC motif-containing protein (DUF1111 family)